MNRLEDFLPLSQKELFSKLRRMFKNEAIYSKDGYVLVQGEAPIMLLAHLDTVHKERVKQICKTHNGNILMSPQGIGGDDRCGVYALVKLHRTAVKKPWLLFTCDEETGGGGATTFSTHHQKGKLPKGVDEMKLLIELDRKGEKDAVYYDCENDEFEDYITSKGFKTEWGTFSDISIVAPELGVAAVNLSSGYYNAHTQHEYIDRNQLNTVVKKVEDIIADAVSEDFPKYEYVESKFRGGDDDLYSFGRGGFRSSKNYVFHTGHSILGSKGKSTANEDELVSAELKDIPSEILDNYVELLELYTPGELNALREEYGDKIISTLYDSEIGCYDRYEFEDYRGRDSDADKSE